MVYCNLIDANETSARYAYGSHPTSLTGEIYFDGKNGYFEIIKEPENDTVYLKCLKSLYWKYYRDFEKGVFREKIAFEA